MLTTLPTQANSIGLIDLFKCFSDEKRLLLLMLLKQTGPACVCDLTAAMDIDQPQTSRHLRQLRALNLVTDERRGQWVFYRLHPDLPHWVGSVLEQIPTQSIHNFDNILTRLKQIQTLEGRCC